MPRISFWQAVTAFVQAFITHRSASCCSTAINKKIALFPFSSAISALLCIAIATQVSWQANINTKCTSTRGITIPFKGHFQEGLTDGWVGLPLKKPPDNGKIGP